jgi:subtilisin family serine protease
VVAAEPNVAADLPEFFGGRRLFWADLTGPDPTASAAAATVAQPALGHAGLPASGATGAGVVVAVLDTGLDAAHPAFAGKVVRGYDVVDRDADPSEVADGIDQNANGEVDEAFGHGTYVAGIVRLVAPGARIIPIRIIDTDGRTNAWWLLQGVQRAQARGARVVNLSLGGLNLGQIVARDLEARAAAGLVLVAAAGNEATIDQRYPAANAGVVGVTAIDGATGAVASFANTGSWIDVAAPGVRIASAFPGGRYAVWGGTSAAAPVVAGALAMVAEVSGPTAAVDDLVDRVTATAVADGLDNVSAYGRVDVSAAVTRALG